MVALTAPCGLIPSWLMISPSSNKAVMKKIIKIGKRKAMGHSIQGPEFDFWERVSTLGFPSAHTFSVRTGVVPKRLNRERLVQIVRICFSINQYWYVCLGFYAIPTVFQLFTSNSSQIHASLTIFNQYLTST